MKLQIHILAQAVEDVLRFELGLPLVGARARSSSELYEEALGFILRHPQLIDRWKRGDKQRWLREVEHARFPSTR